MSDNTLAVSDIPTYTILRPRNHNFSIDIKGERKLYIFDREDYTTMSYTLLYLLIIYVIVSALYIVYKMFFATSNNISNKS
jgi:hypothetical protein